MRLKIAVSLVRFRPWAPSSLAPPPECLTLAAQFLHKWHSRVRFGAQAADCPGTFDTYDHVDNLVYMSVHDAIKRRKLGYGRVRDHLCQEIRFGRISRSDAMMIETLYEQAIAKTNGYPALNQMFFDWLGMNAQAFHWLLDYHFGVINSAGYIDCCDSIITQSPFLDGYLRTTLPVDAERKFILIGKGLSV